MSKEFKHTPGPWDVIEGPHCLQIHAIGHWIANIKCESTPASEQANANLIGAAPELLDVALAALPFADQAGMLNGVNIVAAIAKARGE